jgi:hypothetical protein
MIMSLKDRIRLFHLERGKAQLILTQSTWLTNSRGIKKLVSKKVSDSLVGNFLATLIYSQWGDLTGTYWRTTPVNAYFSYAINTAGVAVEHTPPSIIGSSGVANRGIGWGTTVNPIPSILDYTAINLIQSGTGPGQLLYQSESIVPIGVVGNSFSFGILRAGINSSGAPINTTEVFITGYQTPDFMIMYHNVENQVIPANATITTEIDFKVTT